MEKACEWSVHRPIYLDWQGKCVLIGQRTGLLWFVAYPGYDFFVHVAAEHGHQPILWEKEKDHAGREDYS